SFYKDAVSVNYTNPSYHKFENYNLFGFAEDNSGLGSGQEPFISIQLPQNKLYNKLSVFIELKNSPDNISSDYSDTSNYYLWGTLGEFSKRDYNTFDMLLEKNKVMSSSNIAGEGD